jgi:RecA-family ATPase
MQSLLQVGQGERGAASQPLPELLPALTQKGIRFERGQVCMVVAAPNGGKSMLSLWYAISARVPSFYFSCDTDKRTTRYRAAAIATGLTFDEVKAMDGTSAQDIIDDAGQVITDAGIQFSFDPAVSLEDIDMELLAYEEVYGEGHLQMVVIDNLLNVESGDSSGDFASLLDTMAFLHQLARQKDCAVVILHHVNESSSKHASEYPYPRGAIRGKVSQYPEIILSLAMLPDEGQMRIACVKHRHATPSPSGEDYVTIYVDAPRMSFFNTLGDMRSAQAWRSHEQD